MDSSPQLNITNLVVTFRLAGSVPLPLSAEDYKAIAERVPGADYRPRRFHAIILRGVNATRCSALIYKSGRCVLAGAGKTVEEAQALVTHVCRLVTTVLASAHRSDRNVTRRFLRPCGGRQLHSSFRVVNVVASVRLPFRIRVESVMGTHTRADYNVDEWRLRFDYDPTMFPALKCRVARASDNAKTALTLLTFHNGKTIATGMASFDALHAYYERYVQFIADKMGAIIE
jgi:TATA-box binding protein (TBP) (component of TFIID and TFIIIB)